MNISVCRFDVRFAHVATMMLILRSLVMGPQTFGDDVKIDLSAQSGTIVSCRMQADFAGEVVLFQAGEDAENRPNRLPLEVHAVHQFDQIIVDQQNALRKYSSAEAKIEVDGKGSTSQLSEANRQIALRGSDSKFGRPVHFFSTGGALRQTEQELLLVPCDLFGLTNALHQEATQVGEKWSPTNDQLKGLLSLDNIIENNVTLMVKEVDSARVAKVYLMGDCLGEVDGAKTKIQLTGVALVETSKNLIKAFRASITERRNPSQLAPGFHGTIKIDLACSSKGNKELDDEKIKQVAAKISEKQSTRLLWNSDSEFEMVYDSRWKIILSDPEVVIMRYAEKGNLLAQCNVLGLPRRPENKPLKLDEFRIQLEKTVLGDAEARVTDTKSFATPSGLNVHRIVVTGIQEQIPIHWIYYHLSNPEGRCAAVVMTIEDAALASFGTADARLLESIHFVDKNRNAQTPKIVR